MNHQIRQTNQEIPWLIETPFISPRNRSKIKSSLFISDNCSGENATLRSVLIIVRALFLIVCWFGILYCNASWENSSFNDFICSCNLCFVSSESLDVKDFNESNILLSIWYACLVISGTMDASWVIWDLCTWTTFTKLSCKTRRAWTILLVCVFMMWARRIWRIWRICRNGME